MLNTLPYLRSKRFVACDTGTVRVFAPYTGAGGGFTFLSYASAGVRNFGVDPISGRIFSGNIREALISFGDSVTDPVVCAIAEVHNGTDQSPSDMHEAGAVAGRRVCFVDSTTGKIYGFGIDNNGFPNSTPVEMVTALPGDPDSIIGAPSGDLYYHDGNQAVWKIAADDMPGAVFGTHATELTALGPVNRLVGIDETYGKIFYREAGGSSHLYVADLDGSNPTSLSVVAAETIDDQASCLDPANEYIYYTGATPGLIRRCDYDGGNDTAIGQLKERDGTTDANDVHALHLVNGRFVYLEDDNDSILSCPIGDLTDVSILVDGNLSDINVVEAFEHGGGRYIAMGGDLSSTGHSNLLLYDWDAATLALLDPAFASGSEPFYRGTRVLAFVSSEAAIYALDDGETTLRKVPINGDAGSDITVTGVTLTAISGLIYDSANDKIVLYGSTAGETGGIYRCDPDGTNGELLLELTGPPHETDSVVHTIHNSRIYFVDGDTYGACDLDGGNPDLDVFSVVSANSRHLFFVTDDLLVSSTSASSVPYAIAANERLGNGATEWSNMDADSASPIPDDWPPYPGSQVTNAPAVGLMPLNLSFEALGDL